MKTKTINIYSFEELSEDAKQQAINDYRNNGLDYEWWDSVFEDVVNIADILGIDLRRARKTLMDNTYRYDPTIYFSGFASQGDGACFEGEYKYRKGSCKEIRAYAPQDQELHRIADSLFAIQNKHFFALTASIGQTGRYHNITVDVDANGPAEYHNLSQAEDDLTECFRNFCHWIYHQLEKEWEYQNSDETISENIIANEYEFDEDGNLI